MKKSGAKRAATSPKQVTPVLDGGGKVFISYGVTVNLGNYNSAKADVGITLPFDANIPGDRDRAYNEAREWTRKRMLEEKNALVASVNTM